MKTTILVERETRELLREIGKKRQTYDDIINDLAKKAGFTGLMKEPLITSQ